MIPYIKKYIIVDIENGKGKCKMFGKKKKKNDIEKKFEYCVENAVNDSVFKAQCKSLKDNLIDLIDDGETVSDDGSVMRFFIYRDMEITVMYDTELQEVYVSSPIDVSEYIIKS